MNFMAAVKQRVPVKVKTIGQAAFAKATWLGQDVLKLRKRLAAVEAKVDRRADTFVSGAASERIDAAIAGARQEAKEKFSAELRCKSEEGREYAKLFRATAEGLVSPALDSLGTITIPWPLFYEAYTRFPSRKRMVPSESRAPELIICADAGRMLVADGAEFGIVFFEWEDSSLPLNMPNWPAMWESFDNFQESNFSGVPWSILHDVYGTFLDSAWPHSGYAAANSTGDLVVVFTPQLEEGYRRHLENEDGPQRTGNGSARKKRERS